MEKWVCNGTEVRIDPARFCVSRNGTESALRPQTFKFLQFLIEQRHRIVLKNELGRLWEGVGATDESLVQCVAEIRRAMGETAREPAFIRTAARRGYQFMGEPCSITPDSLPSYSDPLSPTPIPVVSISHQEPQSHRLHVLCVTFLYGCLCGVSVGIEVAYDFESYQILFFAGSATVGLATFLTTFSAFKIQRSYGVVQAALVHLAAGLLSYAVIASHLPDRVLVQASFQTLTAQAAYFKDVIYSLGVSFLVIAPYEIVLRRQRRTRAAQAHLVPERGAVLGVAIIVFLTVAGAFIGTAHLLDSLILSKHSGLFQRLIWLRLGLFFILATETVLWFWRTTEEEIPAIFDEGNEHS